MRDPRRERWWVRRERKRAERAGLDPDTFFSDRYIRSIAKGLIQYRGMRGRLVVAVRGLGIWTLNLGDVDTPVEDGDHAGADARLCFVPTTFKAFLDGSLDVETAMAAGHVTVRGDARLVMAFGRILNPPHSILQARAACR